MPDNGEEQKKPLEPEVYKESYQLARAPARDIVLAPVMDIATAKKRLKEFQDFVKEYLVEGEDFGPIPGTSKPTLLKPGADKLCELYGFADVPKIVNQTEDWERGLFDYTIECALISRRDGSLVATGLGSCNSYEGKYRYRDAHPKCPQCGKEAIIKGKPEFAPKNHPEFAQGGWICFKKKGGCGAQFRDADESIIKQPLGKVENEDIATLKNTILKMALKRALISATLHATRSSGIFSQDLDDMGLEQHAEEKKLPEKPATQAKPATPAVVPKQTAAAPKGPPKAIIPPMAKVEEPPNGDKVAQVKKLAAEIGCSGQELVRFIAKHFGVRQLKEVEHKDGVEKQFAATLAAIEACLKRFPAETHAFIFENPGGTVVPALQAVQNTFLAEYEKGAKA